LPRSKYACNESTEHTGKNNERHCERRTTGNDSELAAKRTLLSRTFIEKG
jgi:hypothetical protein